MAGGEGCREVSPCRDGEEAEEGNEKSEIPDYGEDGDDAEVKKSKTGLLEKAAGERRMYRGQTTLDAGAEEAFGTYV